MEENSLDYLKKPQLHKNEYIVIGNFHIFCFTIIPDKIMENRKLSEITYLDDKYDIDGFIVITKENKIQKILLAGVHPNCNPENNEYCLNKSIINKKLNEKNLSILIRSIGTYHFDDCYFKPSYKDLKYKELNSIFMRRRIWKKLKVS